MNREWVYEVRMKGLEKKKNEGNKMIKKEKIVQIKASTKRGGEVFVYVIDR